MHVDSDEEKGGGQRVFSTLDRKQKHKDGNGVELGQKASVSSSWHKEEKFRKLTTPSQAPLCGRPG